jgi:hypothetical protein
MLVYVGITASVRSNNHQILTASHCEGDVVDEHVTIGCDNGNAFKGNRILVNQDSAGAWVESRTEAGGQHGALILPRVQVG